MRKVTTKVDVFSFGIIAMELITRRRPTGLTGEDQLPITLRQLVQKALDNSSKGLSEILDPYLAANASKKQDAMEALLDLALSCTCPDPQDRPNMEEVLSTLSRISKMA